MPVKKTGSATITAAEEGIATNPTTGVEAVTTDAAAVTVTNPTTEAEAAMTEATTAALAIGTAPSATTQTLHSVRNATAVGNHAETLHRSLETVATIGETTTDVVVSNKETTDVAVDATIHETAGIGIAQNATITITHSGRSATAVGNPAATRLEGPVTTMEVADVTADMAAGTTTGAGALTAGTTTDVAVDASETRTNPNLATGPATIVEPTISRAEPRASSAALTHETVVAEATDVDLDRTAGTVAEATDVVLDRTADTVAEATDVDLDRTAGTVVAEATDVDLDRTADSVAEATDVDLDRTVDTVAEAIDVDLDRTADTVAEATDVDLDRTADSVAEATDVDLDRTGTAEANDADPDRTGTAEANDADLGKIAVVNVTVDKAGFYQRVPGNCSGSPKENPMDTRTTVAQSPSVAREAMTIEGAEHGGGPLPRRLGSPE